MEQKCVYGGSEKIEYEYFGSEKEGDGEYRKVIAYMRAKETWISVGCCKVSRVFCVCGWGLLRRVMGVPVVYEYGEFWGGILTATNNRNFLGFQHVFW